MEKPIRAYDLGFGPRPDRLLRNPTLRPSVNLNNPMQAGFVGDFGPNIRPEQWPRGKNSGLPMMHAITVWVPDEYRKQGNQYVAVSFFQGEGQFSEPKKGIREIFAGQPLTSEQVTDPFLKQLTVSAAHEHPMLWRLQDIIDGEFGLIWLTDEEFRGPRTAPPPDPRRAGEHEPVDGDISAWDNTGQPDTFVWMSPREGDLNVGVAPQEFAAYDPAGQRGRFASNGYRVVQWDEDAPGEDGAWARWLNEHQGRSHFGGTSFHQQGVPEGLGPYYLELYEFGGLKFGGGGVAQIDLETAVFDWA
ncbi:hypothetical protein [Corynebacterium cystitidis]|uniref:DUF1963 domain-containing protein n=1 Tax=Corynebacterium cystitidis DSM 20524 TaxID=1121357 RepID=A0A1H9UWQ4_9CORY|nr:hypothetical protein [Corynebacterium cystitidis]WJY83666.1 hypothetical protein CCYS_13925 [Corynebacterium cystitidis DSM 20524]SES13905.1 hypothetical protein SAMN05661109_01970 [Corynebacterium cystitidis DSM 20524]SNV91436.1 Uncharacterised protein [Corynebacterium cystitidis]